MIKKLIRNIYISIRQIRWSDYRWANLDKTKILLIFRFFGHPIDTFNDIKYEKRGSLAIANILLLLFFLEGIVNYFLVGYLFSNNEAQSFSVWPILLRTVGIVVLWCVMNWAMSTLFEGKGTFKEIWMATCYSLTPMVLFSVPLNAISNVMTLSEAMFYNAVSGFLTAFSLVLVFLGMLVVHQYTVTKTVGTVILTLAMIVIFIFLVLLGFSVSQQIVAFVSTIATELLRR